MTMCSNETVLTQKQNSFSSTFLIQSNVRMLLFCFNCTFSCADIEKCAIEISALLYFREISLDFVHKFRQDSLPVNENSSVQFSRKCLSILFVFHKLTCPW